MVIDVVVAPPDVAENFAPLDEETRFTVIPVVIGVPPEVWYWTPMGPSVGLAAAGPVTAVLVNTSFGGGLTVNDVAEVTVFVPSDTEIGYVPFGRLGTMNVAVTFPFTSLDVPAVIVAVVVPTVMVRGKDAPKHDPLIETDVPTGPVVGLGAPTVAGPTHE